MLSFIQYYDNQDIGTIFKFDSENSKLIKISSFNSKTEDLRMIRMSSDSSKIVALFQDFITDGIASLPVP